MYAQYKVFKADPLFDPNDGDAKVAILVVHFGTTQDDTRSLTLDAINKAVAEAHPQFEVREAYSSRIVIKRLAKRGIHKLNPPQALEQLADEGFTHVLVVPTSLTDGVEMEAIWIETAQLMERFEALRVVTPILFHETDYEPLIEMMVAHSPKDEVTVWIGHGTYDVATAQYAMLAYMLQSKGYHNIIVGCVEGYPRYEQALAQIQALGAKKLVLRPLMVVAGVHAKEDIAGEWNDLLTAAGYEVELQLEGMGELKALHKILNDKIDFYLQNRRIGIKEKKDRYEKIGQKMHSK